jgi:hypothetical protein
VVRARCRNREEIVMNGTPRAAQQQATTTAPRVNTVREPAAAVSTTTTPFPGSNRRGTARRYQTKLRSPCRLRRAIGTETWFAVVRNVSRDGVGLLSNRPFKARMLLAIELPTKDGKFLPPKAMCVKHAEPVPGTTWWALGGVFAHRLTEEEVHGLLA